MVIIAEELFCQYNQVSNLTSEIRVGNITIGCIGGTCTGGVINRRISFVTTVRSICYHLSACTYISIFINISLCVYMKIS